MACNVYLALFHHYNTELLRPLEWKYFLLCYGLPFIPALVFLFIETKSNGKVYGDAVVSLPIAILLGYLPLTSPAMVLDLPTMGLAADCSILCPGVVYYCNNLHYISSGWYIYVHAATTTGEIHTHEFSHWEPASELPRHGRLRTATTTRRTGTPIAGRVRYTPVIQKSLFPWREYQTQLASHF